MKLLLPLPPSVNAMYRNVAGVGRVKTHEYRAWLKKADAYLLMQKRELLPLNGQIIVAIKVPKGTRGDISNRIKAAEDFLVSRQITGDDRHNVKVSIERADVQECEVEVTPA
jgi:crossover junction endodeoxyribonuclease RusA